MPLRCSTVSTEGLQQGWEVCSNLQPAASVTKCTSPGQPATAGHKMVQYHYTIYTLHSVLYYYTILLFKIIYI